MKISEFRCLGSVLLERCGQEWFDDRGLVLSLRRPGLFFGRCLHCGKCHYDRLPEVRKPLLVH